MILTSVEKVSLNHNTDQESYLDTISTEDAKKYIADDQFAAGSMLPKIEAGVSFVEKKAPDAVPSSPIWLTPKTDTVRKQEPSLNNYL